MAESKQFTLNDIASHTSKDDLYIVVHDKVYDCSKFVDEHPGGEEVMIDVGGQDATEAFEDVGHSDEARALLKDMLIGDLKREAGDPPAKTYKQASTSVGGGSGPGSGSGVLFYLFLLIGAGVAYYIYGLLQGGAKNTTV